MTEQLQAALVVAGRELMMIESDDLPVSKRFRRELWDVIHALGYGGDEPLRELLNAARDAECLRERQQERQRKRTRLLRRAQADGACLPHCGGGSQAIECGSPSS